MKHLILILTASILSLSVYASDMSHCNSFVQNDPEFKDLLKFKSNGQLDKQHLEDYVGKGYSKTAYNLNKDVGNGFFQDTLQISTPFGSETIIVTRSNGQLYSIEKNFPPLQSGNSHHTNTRTYQFDVQNGKCFPSTGIEVNTQAEKNSLLTRSQLFDTDLCHQLDNFFKTNPGATKCEDDFEKRSSKLLENYLRNTEVHIGGSFNPGGPFNPKVYSPYMPNNPFSHLLLMPLINASQTEQKDSNQKGSQPTLNFKENRTQPKRDNSLSLAIALQSDCKKDPRLESTLADKKLFGDSSMAVEKSSKSGNN
ncbi:MAG: hypothetical protein KDD50_02450 [Bdellovibrionales bacterium]|nr:hypothetical protein [Bdellovibrionales bacterium]